MSITKTKMSYDIALTLAQTVVIDLAPTCERIEIAGSIRRKKPEIGDLEVVCIPAAAEIPSLFGPEKISALDEHLNFIIRRRGWRIIKNGQWYKQFDIGPCNLDLFITTPEKFGCVFTIRTGSPEFSHRLVTKKRLGGLCPAYMSFNAGRLWNNGVAIATPEERDVFVALGLKWIPPEERLR